MSRTYFTNVDLDVHSTKPLRRLARAMDSMGAVTLHCGRVAPGRYRASFELGHSPRSADSGIRALARLVRRLPEADRSLWTDATLRDFCVGISAGSAPFAFECAVKPTTVAAIAALDAQISYVVYAPRDD